MTSAKSRRRFRENLHGISGRSCHGGRRRAYAPRRKIGVKASGGIRTASDARAMIAAGATRLGTSGGVKIVRELRDEAGGE